MRVSVNRFGLSSVLFSSVLLLLLGCDSSGVKDKMKKAKDKRNSEALASVDQLVGLYGQNLDAAMRAHPGTMTLPLLRWRQDAALARLDTIASQHAGKFEDTEARGVILNGHLVLRSLQDFWLGRVIQGLRDLDDLQNETAAAENRHAVPFKDHMERLAELEKRAEADPGAPWVKVIAFERELALLRALWPRLDPATTMHPSDEMQWVLGDVSPHAICEKALAETCPKINFEHRHLAVRKHWADTSSERLAAFRKTHGDFSIKSTLDRLAVDMADAAKRLVVPAEYPVLPHSSSPYQDPRAAALKIGGQGIRFDMKNLKRDVKMDLMAARQGWVLTRAEKATLVKETRRAWGEALYSLYAEVSGDIEVSALSALLAVEPGGVAGVMGRDRRSGKLRKAWVAGIVSSQTEPIVVPDPTAPWLCTSLFSVDVTPPEASDLTRALLLTATDMRLVELPAPADPAEEAKPSKHSPPAPPALKSLATATLDDAQGLKAMAIKLAEPDQRTLFAVQESVKMSVLHQAFNGVLFHNGKVATPWIALCAVGGP